MFNGTEIGATSARSGCKTFPETSAGVLCATLTGVLAGTFASRFVVRSQVVKGEPALPSVSWGKYELKFGSNGRHRMGIPRADLPAELPAKSGDTPSDISIVAVSVAAPRGSATGGGGGVESCAPGAFWGDAWSLILAEGLARARGKTDNANGDVSRDLTFLLSSAFRRRGGRNVRIHRRL